MLPPSRGHLDATTVAYHEYRTPRPRRSSSIRASTGIRLMNDKLQQPDIIDDEPATLFERVTRRSFLTRVGAAGVAVSTGQLHSLALADSDDAIQDGPPSGNVHVQLNVNGTLHE